MSTVSSRGDLPHGVEYPAIPVDPEQLVGRGHRVQMGLLPIEEASVWLPDLLQDIHTDVEDPERAVIPEHQPGVHPALPEVAVHLVGLQGRGQVEYSTGTSMP